MYLILTSSSMEGMSSSFWLTIWVMLEVNTMALCFVLTKNLTKEKSNNKTPMKYFLVQMSASAMLALLLSSSSKNPTSELLVCMCLLAKIGSWPSHTWYVSMVKEMKMSDKSFWVLMTWQKIMPLSILSNMETSENTKNMVMLMCLASILAPMMKMKKTNNKKSILALSSLSMNGWVILVALQSTLLMISFILLYMMMMWVVVEQLKKNSKMEYSSLSKNKSMLFSFATMSGLPPFSMFWMKMMIIYSSVSSLVPKSMLVTLLWTSCGMALLYTMMLTPQMMKYSKKTQMSEHVEVPMKKMDKMTMICSVLSMSMIYTTMTYSLNQSGSSW